MNDKWFQIEIGRNKLMVSGLIKPLDTPHNRAVSWFGNPNNDQLSIRMSRGDGAIDDDVIYLFLNRDKIEELVEYLSKQLLK
jgi:hypothetical protein